MALLLYAKLTWNLVSGTLFIGLPSVPVVEVCIGDELCVTPDNPVVIVLPWDGAVPSVSARFPDGSQQWAVPWPAYIG